METYWVEGLFVTKRGLKKAQKSGQISSADVEPFARSFWANSPDEAVRMAAEELKGGDWTEGPRVTKTSEEKRMRAMGAPELPGFGPTPKKHKSH